jgi:hypothetical protein
MEDMQRQNSSPIHRLLSSFVSTDPQKIDRDSEKIENMPAQMLLPAVSNHAYLCYPFEERLMMELESAGLVGTGVPDPTPEAKVFESEIEHFERELGELRPKIRVRMQDLIENLPEYREDEARRLAERQEFLDLMKDSSKRRPVKRT